MRSPLAGLLALLVMCSLAAPVLCDEPDSARPFDWRGVWEWSMKKSTEADLVHVADTAQSLGFNALLMSPPRQHLAFMRDRCHERGIELYLSTVFTGGDKGWQQVMLPREQERVKQPFGDTYQQGGEPFSPDELFSGALPCWNRPEVREHFCQKVADFASLPVDGLAFDMVGYANYRRCYCTVCSDSFARFRAQHRSLSRDTAEVTWAEQSMVDFVNEMASVARQTRPDMKLTIHVYPYFRPDPYHGNRLDVDYAGQTVAWFFSPHWPLDKVSALSRQIVSTQSDYHPRSLAAPFIGFYHRPIRNVRSARRMCAEIEAIRASGADAIQFAELGNIASDGTVARAVAKSLGGPDFLPID